MNAKCLQKFVCASLAGGAVLFGGPAEASVVIDKVPMLTYADHTVPTYDDPNGRQKGYISPNVALVLIKTIRPDGWAYGSYPIAGGKRVYRWFNMADLQGFANFENYSLKIEGDQTVYRTSVGNSKTGTVLNNANALVVGEAGDNLKIIYRVNGGNEYKMGWIVKPVPVNNDYNDYNDGGGNYNGGGSPYGVGNIHGNIYIVHGNVTADNVDAAHIDNSRNDNSINDNSQNAWNEVNDYSYNDSSRHTNINKTDNSSNTYTQNIDNSTETTNNINVDQSQTSVDNSVHNTDNSVHNADNSVHNTDNSVNTVNTVTTNTTTQNITHNNVPGKTSNSKIPSDAAYWRGHHYYIYYDKCRTWDAAKAYCESLGGHLAIINDASENNWLYQFVRSKNYTDAYFGLSDKAQSNNWRWVDGSPATYTNWNAGEPNHDRNEFYAMFYWKCQPGKWNDGAFDEMGTMVQDRTFICEWEE